MKRPIRYYSAGNGVFHLAHLRRNFPLLTFILLSITLHAQWSVQSPIPTYLEIQGIAAPTTQRVFIATDDDSFDNLGALFESTDGGATWAPRDIPVGLGSPLNGIFFLDDQHGWVFGNDNYRTIDDGTTWTQLPFIGSTYSMEFYTPSLGLASIGLDKLISHDGGDTWTDSPDDISRIGFIDDTTGLGLSQSGIYRTTDGAVNFSQVLNGNALDVAVLSASVAISIANDTIWRSADGGLTWNPVIPAEERSYLVPVSEDVVLAWGRSGFFPDLDGRIFRSSDGGQTWTDLGEVMFPDPYGAAFAFTVTGPQTIVASDGGGGMYHSADAGVTWTQVFDFEGAAYPSFFSNLKPVFPDALTGYFGFGSGIVIKTTDGGLSWEQVSSGTNENMNDIDRFPNGDLIAVGDHGSLLTNVGGTSPWLLQPAFSQYDLVNVQILNTTDVIVLDEIGQLFTSTDAGNSWVPADSVPEGLSPAEDMEFSSLLDGWVLGQGFDPPGVLYHTTDGGSTWTAANGFGGAYKALDVQATNIWAANVSGRYYRSTNNGTSWIQGDLPGSPHQIQDMEFWDTNIGYAVGWWGQAYRSEDGGISWEELPTPNEDDQFTDIFLLGPNEFWISTNDDKAYYSANGGLGWTLLETNLGNFASFSAITATPAGDAWMVGQRGHIMHFSGPPGDPLNQPPNAGFGYNATGLTVEFTDTSSDLDGNIVAWYWDFKDGNTSTEQHPTHTYAQAYTYWVELTVWDDDGAANTALRIFTVQELPGGTWGDFTEVTPLDHEFYNPLDEDFWVVTSAPADFDGDGDLDIALLGYDVVYLQSAEERLVILRNDGQLPGEDRWDFYYYDVPLGNISTGASDLAWGDADGDGDLDLAVGSNGMTVIYKNSGGVLSLTDTQLPGYWEDNGQADFDLRSITWADYDNDNDADLLIPSVYNDTSYTFRTALMRNDGPNGTGGWIFTEVDSVFAPTSHAQSAWADYDGDLDLDLLLINLSPLDDEGFIIRYRNDGNGAFTAEYILDSLVIRHGDAQWGDYDADGDLDILVAGDIDDVFSQGLTIYTNDNDVYTPSNLITCSFCEGWLDLNTASWGDYDSDGDMDILLGGSYIGDENIEGRTRIYKNNGDVFTADSASTLPAPLSSGDRGGSYTWLDIDNDGDLDYFVAGSYFVPGGNNRVQSEMHLYRNDVPATNAAPSTPIDLRVTMESEGSVRLQWAESNDDHTPAAALTYDVEVYPDDLPSSIPYRLPQPGNVSSVNEWQLTGLEEGSYVWTLRAVDASFSGSDLVTKEFQVGTPSGIEDDNGPVSTMEIFPNPMTDMARIRFVLNEEERLEVGVFDLSGRLVDEIGYATYPSGANEIVWQPKGLEAGSYIISIRSQSERANKIVTKVE